MEFNKNWHLPFIALAIIISIYLRVINPWDSVFTWTIRFGGNDPWYYFRLIDNCVHNFPYRIWFDAFTYYPYGTYTHFGPFLVYLGAILVKIFGATDPASMKRLLVFIPAIGGTLLVLPVYLFVKEVFNKEAAVISALLVVIIPGQLLSRSLLGFNDHHVWEVFWMTATLALYIYGLNRNKVIYAIPAGVAYGMYLLTWAPSFYFAILLIIFVFIVLIFNRFIKIDIERLIHTTLITLGVATLIYLPFAFNYPKFDTIHYSPFQLLILLLCIGILILFRTLYLKVKARLPLILTITFAGSIITLFIVFPDFFKILLSIIGVIQPKGGALTIAEVQPFFTMYGKFSLAPAYINFAMTFFFGFLGTLYLIWLIYKERKVTHILMFLWALIMFIALCGQNRFAYYFAIICAVTSGIMLDYILRTLKFYDMIKERKISVARMIIAILVILVLFYPTFTLANEQSKYGGGINKAWWDALVWLRNNTPDKFYDEFYYQLYKPPKDKNYHYPNGTYGVMSWWDYGHWITAIAHRIPIANPFQQGIGNKYNNVSGAAPFFTAFNESYANEIADKLGVKYVITDIEMATGKFYAMAVWAEGSLDKAQKIYYNGIRVICLTQTGIMLVPPDRIPINAKIIGSINMPGENYFKTMEAKLHILDGCGLSHYRMVYESIPTPINSPMGFQEVLYRSIFNKNYADKFGMPKVNETTSGYVKIFEYVKGAKIIGKADADNVTVSLKIKTNQGRIIIWQKTVKVVNGTYEVIVPYAQDTVYPVKPLGNYTIRSGNIVKTFSLTDEDVEKGHVIRIDLI